MSAHEPQKTGSPAANVLRFVSTLAANTLRRLLILGHYMVACWQQQRLRRAWRRLGQLVHSTLEEGEVNPMLTEPVKDALQQVRKLKALKDRQYEAISEIRVRIRQSRTPEPPAPSPEPAGGEQPEERAEQ